MIRKLIAAAGLAAAITLPGAAQTFTHTIDGVTHTHDITTYRTVGTCCIEVQTCGCATTSTVVHHPSTATCGTTVSRSYTYAPTTKRTHTRSYSGPPVARTYTRTYTQAPTVTHRVYVQPSQSAELSFLPDTYRPVYHNDRAEPYAHYDRRWKRRTRVKHR
ncbi:MAG: hypothetical protein AAFR74_07020 [Pseudomonadota bacterium]